MVSMPPHISQVRILIVEDEDATRNALIQALDSSGYRVEGAASGSAALEKLEDETYDLMLLDLHMPGMGGVEVMNWANEACPDLMVIVLTAHATLESAIAAVRAGASDYLLKPCRIQDIEIAIMQALETRWARMRRQHLIRVISEALDALKSEEERERMNRGEQHERFLRSGSLTLDREKRLTVVTNSDEESRVSAELTANEAALLAYMMQRPDLVFSCRDLARSALGYEVDESDAQNIIRPHISRLRKKVEPEEGEPDLIRTVRGKGYLFSPP